MSFNRSNEVSDYGSSRQGGSNSEMPVVPPYSLSNLNYRSSTYIPSHPGPFTQNLVSVSSTSLPPVKIWIQLEFRDSYLAEELTVDPSWTISRLKQEVSSAGLFKSIHQPSDIDCVLFQGLKVKTSVSVSELPEIQSHIFYIRPSVMPPLPSLAPPTYPSLPSAYSFPLSASSPSTHLFPLSAYPSPLFASPSPSSIYSALPLCRGRSPEKGDSSNKRRLRETDARHVPRPSPSQRYTPQASLVVAPPSAASDTLVVGAKATRAEQEAIKTLQGVPMVYVGDRGGVDDQAENLACLFYTRLRDRCHTLTKRGALSALFLGSMPSWAPPEVMQDHRKQRPFKQILYALHRGMEVCEVLDKGKTLKWVDIQSARSLSFREYQVDVHEAKTEPSVGGSLLRSDSAVWGVMQGSNASRVAWTRRPLYFEVRVQKGTQVKLGFVGVGGDPRLEGLGFESSGRKCEGAQSFHYGRSFTEKDTVSALLYYYDPDKKEEYGTFAHAAPDNILTPGQPPAQGTKIVCKYFLQGKCTKGELCTFKHAGSSYLSSSAFVLTPVFSEYCRIEFAINGISQGVAFTISALNLVVPFVAVQQAAVQVVFDQGPLQFRPACVPMTTAEFFDKLPTPETVTGNVCTFWLKRESGCTRADCKFLHQVPTETGD